MEKLGCIIISKYPNEQTRKISMYKRLVKKIRYFKCFELYPEFTFGSLLVAIFCAFLLVVATFTPLKPGVWLSHHLASLNINSFEFLNYLGNGKDSRFYYIPQIPIVIFIGAMLGPRISLISIFTYVVAGLIGIPIFASGGGVSYFLQTSFGYILGYFLGAFLVGCILKNNVNILSIIKASIIGVIAIHLIGIIYLSADIILQHQNIYSIIEWVWTLSIRCILYDLIFSTIAIVLAYPSRALFWSAMG